MCFDKTFSCSGRDHIRILSDWLRQNMYIPLVLKQIVWYYRVPVWPSPIQYRPIVGRLISLKHWQYPPRCMLPTHRVRYRVFLSVQTIGLGLNIRNAVSSYTGSYYNWNRLHLSVREITKSSSTFSATNISSNIVWFLQLHDTIQMKSIFCKQI